MRQFVLVLIFASIFVPTTGSPLGAVGQATPVRDDTAAVCSRELRTVDQVRESAGPPRESAVVISDFSDFPDSLPTGAPVDSGTVGEIRDMREEFVSCVQAGQLLSGFGYYSDHFWREVAFLNEEFLLSLETATPTPEPEIGFFTIQDVTWAETLADGRVGAVITFGGGCERSQPEPTCTLYQFFVEQDGKWFIDDQITELAAPDGLGLLSVLGYLELQGTPAATPTA